ncbi:MAG TPA: hypothetical protein VNU49_07175 [Opitutaceae bacterium]|jgi:hypothetical protein|nr:hypothetical protein [Opitutaceae bacterium]
MKNKGNQGKPGKAKPFSFARLILTIVIAITVMVLLRHCVQHR